MSGFFLLHRGWRENPIFRGEFSRADAWVWLIENACWEPTRIRIKGETVQLLRGELSFSQRFLAEKWGWSKSRVDRFLSDLRDESMIETRSKIGATNGHKAGQGQGIISICNYEKYQGKPDDDRGNNAHGRRGNSGATAGQQRGKEEQGNKGTIVEEEPNGSPSTNACARDGDEACHANENVLSSPDRPKPAKPRKVSMTPDWLPEDLSGDVGDMLAEWPPGRLDSEIAEFREYWIENGEKRPGWDRTFRGRVRTVHARVMREAQNGNRNGQAYGGAASGYRGPADNRDGFARAIDRAGGFDRPDGASRPAGRPDAGDGAGHCDFASPGERALPG